MIKFLFNGEALRPTGIMHDKTVRGERKLSSSEITLPPLPEPITISSVINQDIKSHLSKKKTNKDSLQPCSLQQKNSSFYNSDFFQGGCYYIRLMPTSLHTPARFQYEGTLRIQRTRNIFIASGDLYINDFCKTPTYCPLLPENEERKNIIPVFSRKRYAYYLRATHIHVDPNSRKGIVLELEPFRFQHATQTWPPGEPLTAEIKFSTGPDGVHYWRGDIQTQSKIVMGHMTAVWVLPSLIQSVIELDRVAASEYPVEDMECREWQEVFKKAGWDVTVEISDEDVEEPEDYSWSTSELHQKMLKYRQSKDLDKEWRYHLLAVRELDDKEAFGLMYGNTITGLNDIPREGVAIASHVMFPGKDFWGRCKGKRFGECKEPYLCTAIHEIGHAIMLYRPDNVHENYIMQRTVNIAHNACNVVPPQQFPDNIEWSFSTQDIRLLCHLPDIAVRPGGVSFGTPHHRLPVNARDEVVEADGLGLKVSTLNEVVPIGAPVRVNFSLINSSDQDKQVSGNLSMKTKIIDLNNEGKNKKTLPLNEKTKLPVYAICELQIPDQYFLLDGSKRGYVQEISEKKPHTHIASWLQPKTNLTSIGVVKNILDKDSAHLRPLGQMVMSKDVKSYPENSKTFGTIRNMIQYIRREGKKNKNLDIFIIGSLAGGTGAGIWIDIAYCVRKIAEDAFISKNGSNYSVVRDMETNKLTTIIGQLKTEWKHKDLKAIGHNKVDPIWIRKGAIADMKGKRVEDIHQSFEEVGLITGNQVDPTYMDVSDSCFKRNSNLSIGSKGKKAKKKFRITGDSLCSHSIPELKSVVQQKKMMEETLVERVIKFILTCPDKKFADISIGTFAYSLKIDRYKLLRQLKRRINIALAYFLFKEKIALVVFWLIAYKNITVKKVANRIGFCTNDYFKE